MTTTTTEALIVNATAGSGKTTTIVDGISHCVSETGVDTNYTPSNEQLAIWDWMKERIDGTKEVVFLAFNKSIATELQERIVHGNASTIHSLGYKILRSSGVKCNKPDTWKTANLYCKYQEIESLKELDKEGRDIFDEVREVVKMCKDQLMTEDEIDNDSVKMLCLKQQFPVTTDYDILVPAVKYIIETGSKVKSGIMAKPIDIDFDDMIYLPARYGYKTQFDVMLVDEAQDLSHGKLQLILNQDCDTYIFIGDPCQPAGTMVKKVSIPGRTSQKAVIVDSPIEDIKVGDYVVSYQNRDSSFIQNGREVTGVSVKEYDGKFIRVTTDTGRSSEYTANHHCLVNFTELRDKHAVYLMQKGNQFRIGKSKMNYGEVGSGPIKRAIAEDADRMWLLSLCDTDKEALASEGAISGKFGLPELCFKACNNDEDSQTLLDTAWEFIGNNSSRAIECLEYFGRYWQYPIWDRASSYTSFKRPIVIRACNIVDGALCLVYKGEIRSHRSNWEPVTVTKRTTRCKVYSLTVDKEHLYVADSIVTHNCQAIYGFAGADTQSFASIAEQIGDVTTLPLSYTYRCGKAIVEEARKIVGDAINYGPNNPDGSVTTVDQEDMELTEGDMLVSRVNAPLMAIAWGLVKERKNVKVVGRDIGKGLIKLIKRLAGKGVKKIDNPIELAVKVEAWRSKEIQMLQNKKADTDMQQMVVTDQADCISQIAGECGTITEMIEFIDGLFDDSDVKKCIRLSSIHRAKGLEASRVFFFNPANVPHPLAKTEEAVRQEYNLKFVATTRAIHELIYVLPKKKDKK